MSLSQQKGVGVETRPNGTNPRKEAVDTLQRALHIAHELLDEKLTGRSLREFEIIGLQKGEMMRCSEIDIVDVCVWVCVCVCFDYFGIVAQTLSFNVVLEREVYLDITSQCWMLPICVPEKGQYPILKVDILCVFVRNADMDLK